MAMTKLNDLVNPQVMADMISAKIEKALVVSPFAKIDNTLQGRAGDTITIPTYDYIGDADDVAEGVACGTVKLAKTTKQATVKKVMKAIELTDEAVLSGYGNPVGESNSQLGKSVASKIDADCMKALLTAQVVFDGSGAKISYGGIVDAVDLFDEEIQSEKVMFINPKQVTTLRKDADFISREKYNADVMITGEIGMIAGTRIVPSKRVELDSTSAFYQCPIIKLNNDAESEDDAMALTVFLKRDTNVETERNTLSRTTDISVDKLYAVAITNQQKVVLAKFKK